MSTLPITRPAIVTIVVLTIAVMAIIGLGVIAAILILGISPDQAVFTAFVGLVGQATGTLTGLLINTRTTPSETEPRP